LIESFSLPDRRGGEGGLEPPVLDSDTFSHNVVFIDKEKSVMAKPSQLSVEERLSLVLESLRPDASIADLCRKHGISQTTFYKWRDRFIEGGKQALMNNGQAKGSEAERAKIEELERVIGQQSVEIRVLKKNLNLR